MSAADPGAGVKSKTRKCQPRPTLPGSQKRESKSETTVGSLHEYVTHECAKSSLAFRKPAVAAASRRPARADGPKVGLRQPPPGQG